MAKGDTMSRMQMGIQPGLKTPTMMGLKLPTDGNQIGASQLSGGNGQGFLPREPIQENAVNPSMDVMQRFGAGGSTTPPVDAMNPLNLSPMTNPSLGTSMAAPRMMPPTTGFMQARGKHPMGTNKNKMLKYNSGSY